VAWMVGRVYIRAEPGTSDDVTAPAGRQTSRPRRWSSNASARSVPTSAWRVAPAEHAVEQLLSRAGLAQLGERLLSGACHDALQRVGEQHHVVAEVPGLLGGELRGLAPLDHVEEQRDVGQRPGHRATVVDRGRRLDEDHVRAGIGVGPTALQRAGEPLHRQRVGAGDDDRPVLAGLQRRRQLRAHLVDGDQPLAVEVAAAFGHLLVLELHGRRAGVLVDLDRAPHRQRAAVAGVGVDHDRQGGGHRHPADRFSHVGQPDQADVGQPVLDVGDPGTGQVDRLEAGLLDLQRGQGVGHAGQHERSVRR
jgi:hypothetical protein